MARILLDENLDWRLQNYLPDQFVESVTQNGWAGIKNGELLKRAERDFDIFITMDSNLVYQQNIAGFQIAVFVLIAKSNRLADTLPLMSQVLSMIQDVKPGTLLSIGL